MLPPPRPARRLTGPQTADWVVLGAGLTGLAAARRLAEHHGNARIILLEAQRVGFGACGRSSGFVVDVGHYYPALGIEANRRLIRLARAGISELRQTVREQRIDCEWTERGCLHGAVGKLGMRGIERLCAGLDAMGEPYRRLDAHALAAATGTDYYREAVHMPGTALVQPAALARGLAEKLPENVELFEESPVAALRRDGRIYLECPEGTVHTKRLLLAVNAFTPSLGFLKRRLFPMFTFATLTRPLDEPLGDREEIALGDIALGNDPQWAMVPEERMGSTIRRVSGNRILIRNTVLYTGRVRVTERRRPAGDLAH